MECCVEKVAEDRSQLAGHWIIGCPCGKLAYVADVWSMWRSHTNQAVKKYGINFHLFLAWRNGLSCWQCKGVRPSHFPIPQCQRLSQVSHHCLRKWQIPFCSVKQAILIRKWSSGFKSHSIIFWSPFTLLLAVYYTTSLFIHPCCAALDFADLVAESPQFHLSPLDLPGLCARHPCFWLYLSCFHS